MITKDARFHYYTDPNGLGNIVQKTDKTSGAIDLFEYLTDGKIRKFTKYELLPDATETLKVEYYFDALGRRVAKKITTPSESYTQSYSYIANQDKILLAKDGLGNISLMVDGQGIDEHYAIINQAGVKTFVSDHLGTVINAEVTNEHKVTGVYGEVLGLKPKISKSQSPVLYGYTGRQYDSESGLYYYRARSYDSQSGRFMSKDPKGVSSGDLNLYRYVANQPLNATDPMGLSFESQGGSFSVDFYNTQTSHTPAEIEQRGLAQDIYANSAAGKAQTAEINMQVAIFFVSATYNLAEFIFTAEVGGIAGIGASFVQNEIKDMLSSPAMGLDQANNSGSDFRFYEHRPCP